VNRFTGQYLKRHFANNPPIDQITREQAAEWRAALAAGTLSIENEQRKESPSEQTVCKHVRGARAIFAEALSQELIKINPFDRLRGVAPKVVRNWDYLDSATMTRLLDACPNDGWKAFWALLRFAGLRMTEALQLRWVDVDFAKNHLYVDAPGTADKIDNKHHPRTVPIETARWETGLTKILMVALGAAKDGAVCVCEGVPANNRDRKARKIRKAAGVANYSKICHTLRKNCEMDWAGRFPQHVASEWAGHSITVSASHYLRVPEEMYQGPPREVAQSKNANP
jgi:integrase